MVVGELGRASNRQVIIEALSAVGLVPAVKSAWIVKASAHLYVGVPQSALRVPKQVVKSASMVVVPTIAVPGAGAALSSGPSSAQVPPAYFHRCPVSSVIASSPSTGLGILA